jgi:hypothetical protein
MMIPIVEHKDWLGRVVYERAVRDDLVDGHVACVRCRGRGYTSAGITYGYPVMVSIGWKLRCDDCSGAGAWRETTQ